MLEVILSVASRFNGNSITERVPHLQIATQCYPVSGLQERGVLNCLKVKSIKFEVEVEA